MENEMRFDATKAELARAEAEVERLEKEIEVLRRLVANKFWVEVVTPLIADHGLCWDGYGLLLLHEDEEAPSGWAKAYFFVQGHGDLSKLRVARRRYRTWDGVLGEAIWNPKEDLDGTEFLPRGVVNELFRVLQFGRDATVGGKSLWLILNEMRREGVLLRGDEED